MLNVNRKSSAIDHVARLYEQRCGTLKKCSIDLSLSSELQITEGDYIAVWKENSSRVQCRGQLIVRLIAIEYNERLLYYLSSYINLLMSDLWLKLDLWSRLCNKTFDPDLSPRDDVLPLSRLLLIQCLVVIVIIIIICFWHCLSIGSRSH